MKYLLLGMFCILTVLLVGIWDTLVWGCIPVERLFGLQLCCFFGFLLIIFSFLLEFDWFVKWIGGKNGS